MSEGIHSENGADASACYCRNKEGGFADSPFFVFCPFFIGIHKKKCNYIYYYKKNPKKYHFFKSLFFAYYIRNSVH